jgi:hypothetical protein
MKTAIFSAIAGMVDAGAGVIYGVSVITEGVARGHNLLVDSTTMQQVKTLMDQFTDGTKVKVDHWSGFSGIVGSIKNPRIEGERLRGDFHLLNEHDMHDLILEMAEKQPSTFGFSISFFGIPEEKDKLLYARVTELYSVDLVDDPAANPSGLFSAVDSTGLMKSKSMLEQLKDFLGFTRDMEKPFRDELIQLSTKLAAATKEVEEAKTALSAAEAKVTKLTADLATSEASVEMKAAAKALEMAAAQGIPPIPAGAGSPTAGKPDVIAQHKAIMEKEGPVAATLFYRANKAAFNAAFDAQNKLVS